MKKNILMIAVLALSALSMVSCKKDKISENENGMTTIFARMDSPKAGGEKTHLGPLGEDGITPTHWSANDKVAVFEGTTKYEYTLIGEGGTSEASFTGPALTTGASHCAFYPYDENQNLNATTTSDGSFTVNFDLPQIQTYKEDSFNEGTCPMVAYSNDQKFSFLNMTGVLKLHIEGVGIVGKIVVKDNNTQTPLWGSATVTVENGTTEPAMTVSNDATGCNELILNCPGGVDISDGGKDFYFVLPAGVLSNGFKVDVYNTSHISIEIDKSAVHGNIILRSIISTMKLENVTAPVDGLLPGKFSISASQKVQFSKGNLQLNPSTKTWRFAENQYDYVGNGSVGNVFLDGVKCDNRNVDVNYNGWIDLFGFGDHDGEKSKNTGDYANESNFEDWGNEINGGADGWYTFTRNDMLYLLSYRNENNGAMYRGHATIETPNGNIEGLVILPDDFVIPQDFVSDASSSEISYSKNPYTLQEWSVLEAQGAVFFPASGYRYASQNNDYVTNVSMGTNSYWTKTYDNSHEGAGRYYFNSSSTVISSYYTTCYGSAVRLVRNVDK